MYQKINMKITDVILHSNMKYELTTYKFNKSYERTTFFTIVHV